MFRAKRLEKEVKQENKGITLVALVAVSYTHLFNST